MKSKVNLNKNTYDKVAVAAVYNYVMPYKKTVCLENNWCQI